MSNLIVVDRDKITAIADAIREKTESDLSYTIDEMPDVIKSIIGNGSSSGDEVIFIRNIEIGQGVTNGFEVEVQEVQ